MSRLGQASVAFLTCIAMIGCAKRAEDVAAAYVSPLNYEQFNCKQLVEEAERVSERAAELSGVQDRKRTGDMVATTVAVVVFWPTAFLVHGDDAQTAELARLKGEFDTIQQVSVRKNCTTRFQPIAPPLPPPRRAVEAPSGYGPH